MKVWILALLVGCAVAAPSFQVQHGEERKVSDLFHDIIKETGILDLLPWLEEMVQTDPDAQRFIEYLQGPEFKRIIEHLKGCPGYQETKEELLKEGIDLVQILEDIRDWLSGHGSYKHSLIKPRRTWGELLNEFIKKLDLIRVIDVIKDKIANDPDMKKVIDFLHSSVFKGIVACMKESKDVQDFIEKLKEEDIDVVRLIEMIKALLGARTNYFSRFQSRKVIDLLHDLLKETGIADLLPWFEEMVQTDPDVQRIIEYLQGPEFQRIIEHLKGCPGYQETKEELLKEGVDLVKILEDIRDWLSGHGTQKRSLVQPRRTLGELLNEFISKLDLDVVITVIKDKIANDPDMKKVIDFLHGSVFKSIVECMKESKDVQDLIEKLKKEEDIDVVRLIEMIKALFGYRSNLFSIFQSRKVIDLLHDLLKETGIADLLPWFEEMVQTDPDVQRIIEYLQGPAFQRIIAHLQGCPGYQETKEELLKEGVDLVKILEDIRDWLSGHGIRKRSVVQPRRTLGELLNEFLSKLDLDRVIKVMKDKIANDPDMKKVIDFLHGSVFKSIVECMKESKDVQDLIEKLKNEEDIDVVRLIEMIKALFGYRSNLFSIFQSRKVIDLLHDLLKETGIADLLPWFEEMVQTDPDVKRIIEYLRGPAFQRIIEHLKGCPGYQETKEELLKEGVDLVKILEDIRDWLSGHGVYKRSLVKPRRTLGEILNEFLSKLNLDQVIEVIKNKIANDPDMKKVIDFLHSSVFNGIVECMRESKDVQDLIAKLKDEEEIDVYALIEMIKALFGSRHHSMQKLNPRKVVDLIHELIEEFGLAELLPWFEELIRTDPDVQEMIEYLKGEAFQRIIAHLKQCPGYEETKEELANEGIDLADVLQKIRDWLAGIQGRRAARRTLGELLAELLSRLDINHILSVLQDKIANDPDMKKVIDFLKSETFQGIEDCMGQSQDVQDLIEKLREQGVDVPRLIEMLKAFLGSISR